MTYKLFLEIEPGKLIERHGISWNAAMWEIDARFPVFATDGSDQSGRWVIMDAHTEVGELITENETGWKILRARD